eukprot:scaffold5038_cov147-Skeletonema_dohrnii-CCMP3373.AAC.8
MTHNIVPDRKHTLAVSIIVPGHGWIDLNTPFNAIIRVRSCLLEPLGSSLGFADELSRRGYSSLMNLCRSERSV